MRTTYSIGVQTTPNEKWVEVLKITRGKGKPTFEVLFREPEDRYLEASLLQRALEIPAIRPLAYTYLWACKIEKKFFQNKGG